MLAAWTEEDGVFLVTDDGRTSRHFPSSALGHLLCVYSHAAKLACFCALHLAAGRTRQASQGGTKRRMMRDTVFFETILAHRWR